MPAITKIIADALGKEQKVFEVACDSNGIGLTLSHDLWAKAKDGQVSGRLLEQVLTLRLLEEQELAEEIGNGFYIPVNVAVQLDKETREQVGLPLPWPGGMSLHVEGQSFSSNFYLRIDLDLSAHKQNTFYEIDGPLIRITDSQTYLPDENQWQVLQAVRKRQELSDQGLATEEANLKALAKIRGAVANGLAIRLGSVGEMNILSPETVGLSVEELEDGSLHLIPFLGTEHPPDDIQARLGQLANKASGSIRIGRDIVILDEARMRAVREVVKNNRISAESVPAFLESPSAFLDAELVNLDFGFSIRVHGAERFQPAYFGETEATNLDWFAQHAESTNLFPGTRAAKSLCKTLDELDEFESKFESAVTLGAEQFLLSDKKVILIDDKEGIRTEIERTRSRLIEGGLDDGGGGDGSGEGEPVTDPDDKETVVVDIDDNDEDTEFKADDIPDENAIEEFAGVWDQSNLRLKPYDYQDEGVKWILGLTEHAKARTSESAITEGGGDKRLYGCLLADDMGLGKTYMSLAAIAEFMQRQRSRTQSLAPVIVVAPLGLLENWREEVEKIFVDNPFSSIVILQSAADLAKYRKAGGGRETTQEIDHDGEDQGIRYSLKTRAEGYTTDALDQPGRLVLTSYQTLRDYMFSLCKIKWSFAVFDEAQNIKNPNALQTRAAKGVGADFRLMITGTPVENELRDYWCIFDTARPALLGSYQEFRQQYVRRILNAPEGEKNEIKIEVGKELRTRVGPLMLRRLKEDKLEGLPKKTIQTGAIEPGAKEIHSPNLIREMSGAQLDRYNAAINVVNSELQDEVAGAALSGLHQIRMISLHPDCVSGGRPKLPVSKREALDELKRSAKLALLLEILEEIKSRREKVIIFCITKNLQMFLKVCLEKIYGGQVSVINGDTKAVAKRDNAPTRKRLIRQFEDASGFGAIIMSPVAAGVGLTVVGANNVIHLERHWNPAKEAQATDRVYRIGQEKDVNVYIPVASHPQISSFDQAIAKLLRNKTILSDAIVTPDAVTPEDFDIKDVFGATTSEAGAAWNADRLATISWQYFEALVAEIMAREFDAQVYLTASGSDYGCDVVVLPANDAPMLIQCKHTSEAKYKGHKAITEVVAAKAYYESQLGQTFDKFWVVTNAKEFDSDARKTSKTYGVQLAGFSMLDDWLKKHKVTESQVMRRLHAARFSGA